MNYKNTLNLPKTEFSMRANLQSLEVKLLEEWNKNDLYNLIRLNRKDKQLFILHDGPPYANGDIHIGHAVNKILKDIILKHQVMLDYDVQFIPGWDCHGMPIEIKIEKQYIGKPFSKNDLLSKARSYAQEQIELQQSSFKKLGIISDWNNFYSTMNFQNEANEVRAFGKIMKKGYVFRGQKPVHWCFQCASALAEAEVEYLDSIDKSIDVVFPFADFRQIEKIFKVKCDNGGAVIWTTTPWSLPANQGLNFHPKVEYALVKLEDTFKFGSTILIALNSVQHNLLKWKLNGKIISTVFGNELLKIDFLHPLNSTHPAFNRLSKVYPAEYISLETGTGIVHMAPAYGLEDFLCFKFNGLDESNIISIIGDDGICLKDVPIFGGLNISDLNDQVLSCLVSNGLIINIQNYSHSTMHCWRHKSPLIYRTTKQWFIGMDILPDNARKSLRELTLEIIDSIKFFPRWGKTRLTNMISNRPDWTISRQRQWGVPIPIFLNKKTGEIHPETEQLIEQVAKIIEHSGIDGWHHLNKENFLGKESNMYDKGHDTLDVWFDSGVTHETVLNSLNNSREKKYQFPADVYIEGADQYRGWFHSSLLTSVILNKNTPYKTLISHGFVVDKNKKKMSKSSGNVISPNQILKTFGAEILRLWAASTDYSSDMCISDEILRGIVENYRKIRNTIRFILGNLFDFKELDSIKYTELLEIDQYILLKTADLQEKVISAYNEYNFHLAMSLIQNYCSEELSSFYLDIVKNRLYIPYANSYERRSVQTAIFNILSCLLKLISPVLSFTSEEAWKKFKKDDDTASIFINIYEELPKISNAHTLRDTWNKIKIIREIVYKELEILRENGEIGSSNDAAVYIYMNDISWLSKNIRSYLDEIFIVSSCSIYVDSDELRVVVTPSNNKKCQRCWRRVEDVGENLNFADLCLKCSRIIEKNISS